MTDPSPLRFHVPVPASRPGEKPDFSHVVIPKAGSVQRPPVDVDPRLAMATSQSWPSTSLLGGAIDRRGSGGECLESRCGHEQQPAKGECSTAEPQDEH